MFWNGNQEKISIFIVHVPIIFSFSYRIANTKTICILVTLMCMIFFLFNIPSFNLLVSCYHGLSPLSMILFSLLEHAHKLCFLYSFNCILIILYILLFMYFSGKLTVFKPHIYKHKDTYTDLQHMCNKNIKY